MAELNDQNGGMTPPRAPDNSSESTPLLLSSCSRASNKDQDYHHQHHHHHRHRHLIFNFRGSETSGELESSCDNNSSSSSIRCSGKTGVIHNYDSISVLLKAQLPALKSNRFVINTKANVSLTPTNHECEKFYDIQNANLVFEDKVFDSSIRIKRNIFRELFPKSLPSQKHITTDITDDIKPKQSSLVTIFSVWNTILGSSMLTMPWGIYMAGFVPAIICILAMSGLCLFTAYKLLQVHKYYGGDEKVEVTDLSRIYLGCWAEHMAKIFSISVLMGANIAYWILMSNFLYNFVNFLYDVITDIPMLSVTFNKTTETILCPKEDNLNRTMIGENSYDNLGPIWDLYKTVPIFLALLIFPFLNFNTTTFFTKFNSLGTISIIYLVAFVLVKSASWGINMDKAAWDDIWILRPTFPALSGTLSLSFFIHNIIVTIMQSNRNQEKNGRDLTIAYVLVTMTYIIVGIVFYVCFPLLKVCIEDNLLNNFLKNDGLTVGARVVLLFQLFTVYPLMAYMLRIQLLSSVFKTTKCRQSSTLLINLVIVGICVLFAVFLPSIGTIIRYTGAISGLVYVFTLPSMLSLMISYRQGTINVFKILCYASIPIIGFLNLISQFFIQTI